MCDNGPAVGLFVMGLFPVSGPLLLFQTPANRRFEHAIYGIIVGH